MFDRFFRSKCCEASECTFTNLYIWRKAYNVQWALVHDMLCVTMGWGDENFFLPPYGASSNLGLALQAIETYASASGLPFLIKGATEPTVKLIEAAAPGRYSFLHDPDNDDYVHLTQELIDLKGRKYSAKKNHIHHFQMTYPNYEFIQLTPETASACLHTAYEWYQKKAGNDDSFLDYEFGAVQDSLENFKPLGLRGGAILLYGTVEAFSLGEPLTEQMAVIHVEKANNDIRGAYQMINQECCRYCWPEFTYVNREEDMGIPGLRKAKLSYRPVRMIKKYNVEIR